MSDNKETVSPDDGAAQSSVAERADADNGLTDRDMGSISNSNSRKEDPEKGIDFNSSERGPPPHDPPPSPPQQDHQDDETSTELPHDDDFGSKPECFKNTLQEVLFVFMATIAMATSTFLTGSTVIVTSLIGADLNMTQGEISWISASATLTAGAFQLSLGQIADLVGRKPVFLVGMASFSIGCVIVAFAQNPYWMTILCGVLGLASAMVVPPAIGILGAAYSRPCRRKNWAFACFSAGNPLGFAIGTIVSGVATEVLNWRAGFVFLAIVWAVFAVSAWWIVPSLEAYDPTQPLRQRFTEAAKKFDAVGTLLTVLGVGLLTAGLTLGPEDGWESAEVICMLVIGVVLLAAFIYWETKWPHPLMPPHLWKDRTFSLLLAIAIPGMMAFMSENFWLSLLLQEVKNMSPIMVAVHLLPQVIAGIIWNVVAANILHRVPGSVIMAVGAAGYLAAQILLTFYDEDASYWAYVFPALIIVVAGADFQFNVTNMYVMQALPSHQQGLCGGIFNMLIRLGSTIAIGLSTAVYSSVEETQAAQGDPIIAYRGAFYVSVGLAALPFLFLPFLRIGTQGHTVKAEAAAAEDDVLVEPQDRGELVQETADPEKGAKEEVTSDANEKAADMTV